MQELKALTIWDQINEVQQLQNITKKYLKLYEQSILNPMDHNQFLYLPLHQQLQHNRYFAKSILSYNQQKAQLQPQPQTQPQPQSQPQQQAQSNDIHISRIFKQINLQDKLIPPSSLNTLQIQLQIQGKTISFQLNKNHIYSLSNFSSFKDLKQKDNYHNQLSTFQFQDLITLIQSKLIKKLSKEGIDSLINQLASNLTRISPNHQHQNTQNQSLPFQSQKQTKHAQSIVTLSDSNILNIKYDDLFSCKVNDNHIGVNTYVNVNKYDYELNNHKKNTNFNMKDQALTQITKSNYNFSKKQQKKVENNDSKLYAVLRRQQKQNNGFVVDKKSNKLTKELRIIKKNGQSKVNLTLFYNDTKQIENFCISNKIYGKDKDKIYKAIKNNSTLINLQ